METTMKLNSRCYSINDNGEDVCVSVHSAEGNLIEFFRLKESHLAIEWAWTDEKIVKYLSDKLDAAGR